MVNFKLSRSVAKTTLGRQIQHHAVASPRDRIIHLISNLTTPPAENGRKQLGQMQSGTRLLRRVTLYSPCKSISQLAYLQRFTRIESVLPLEGELRIHFQGVTKWTVQATSLQRGQVSATTSAILLGALCSRDRDGVEFDKRVQGTSEP